VAAVRQEKEGLEQELVSAKLELARLREMEVREGCVCVGGGGTMQCMTRVVGLIEHMDAVTASMDSLCPYL
jgi:hypothetical protein